MCIEDFNLAQMYNFQFSRFEFRINFSRQSVCTLYLYAYMYVCMCEWCKCGGDGLVVFYWRK